MRPSRALLTVIAACCCSGQLHAQLSAYGNAAIVNGVAITNKVLEQGFEEYQNQTDFNVAAIRYPERIKAARREVLEQLIDQELVWQKVQANNLIASDAQVDVALQELHEKFGSEEDFIKRITIDGFTVDSYRSQVRRQLSTSNFMQRVSLNATVSEEEVHQFYVDNPDKFQVPEMIRARHILLKAHPNANDETKAGVRERMNAIVAQLADGADFAALATKYSEDSTAAEGGDLGFFPRGQMVAPFDDAAFALEVGEVSGIVETVYGLHLIKVEAQTPAQIVAEHMARDQVHAYLLQVAQRQAIRDELSALRAAAEIEIVTPT